MRRYYQIYNDFIQQTMIQQNQNIEQDKENVNNAPILKKCDFSQSQWRMRLSKVDIDHAAHIIRNINQAQCQVIYADLNDRYTILADISGPQYVNLKVLDVGNNQIASIEGMRKVNMPKLEKLWLNNNNITSLKPLSRCHLPLLKTLWLSQNLLKEIEADCHFKDIRQFYLQKNIFYSVVNIMKYQLPSLTWTSLSGSPGGDDDQSIIDVSRWEARMRWRFRNLQRVWMPLYFSHIQQRNSNRN